MRLDELYKTLRAHLSESDARYVIKKRTGLSAAEIISSSEKEIDATQALQDLKEHTSSGKPLSRIYGLAEFWGLEFDIFPETLDPRLDTETLIERVLERYKKGRPPETILDLGTGSGCILISLLKEFPQARGIGIDISESAARTARANAKKHGIEARANFICGSWADSLDAKFDLIVSNPPYIAPEVILKLDENVQKYDPMAALDGGKNGVKAYKNIFSQIPDLIKNTSRAFFEIGFDQEESITRLSEESRFLIEGVYRDSAGHPRVVEIFFSKTSGDK